jgi:hypothetical protein
MFKDLQITLYDFFGYLLPGVVVFSALLLLFWSIFWPAVPLGFQTTLPALTITALTLFAYLLGHLGQAVSNFIEKLPGAKRSLEDTLPVSPELGELVRDAVATRFGSKARALAPKELYALCDQALIHAQSLGEREIFIYREGFYRGNCFAFALLALTLVLRMICVPAVVTIAQARIEIYRGELGLTAALAAFGSWMFFRRYLRFGNHKTSSCFMRFLALMTVAPAKKEK